MPIKKSQKRFKRSAAASPSRGSTPRWRPPSTATPRKFRPRRSPDRSLTVRWRIRRRPPSRGANLGARAARSRCPPRRAVTSVAGRILSGAVSCCGPDRTPRRAWDWTSLTDPVRIFCSRPPFRPCPSSRYPPAFTFQLRVAWLLVLAFVLPICWCRERRSTRTRARFFSRRVRKRELGPMGSHFCSKSSFCYGLLFPLLHFDRSNPELT